jgi:hypothetical protein
MKHALIGIVSLVAMSYCWFRTGVTYGTQHAAERGSITCEASGKIVVKNIDFYLPRPVPDATMLGSSLQHVLCIKGTGI